MSRPAIQITVSSVDNGYVASVAIETGVELPPTMTMFGPQQQTDYNRQTRCFHTGAMLAEYIGGILGKYEFDTRRLTNEE